MLTSLIRKLWQQQSQFVSWVSYTVPPGCKSYIEQYAHSTWYLLLEAADGRFSEMSAPSDGQNRVLRSRFRSFASFLFKIVEEFSTKSESKDGM